MKRFVVVLFLACATSVLAQHDHRAMGAMKTSPDARLEVRNDAAAQVLTVRIGPLTLPANSDHMAVAQAPALFLEVPFDGWITAYHPRRWTAQASPSRGACCITSPSTTPRVPTSCVPTSRSTSSARAAR